jgi:hypothetical protein
MIDYSNSQIYAIKFQGNDNGVYIGSTTMNLSARLQLHKHHNDCSLYKYVMSNYAGDWDKCYIELLRNVECKSRKELERIEGEEIKSLMNSQDFILINKNIAGRTHKEYYTDNVNKRKEYYRNNADKRKEYQRNYDKSNADKKKEYMRIYYRIKKDINNSHK